MNLGLGPSPDDSWGEPGLTAAENVYAWNNFCVLAMTSGNPARPVNAVSPSARANCQLRYIAGTDHKNALTVLRQHLDDRGFTNVTIEDPPNENRGGYLASRTEPDNGWVKDYRLMSKRLAEACNHTTNGWLDL